MRKAVAILFVFGLLLAVGRYAYLRSFGVQLPPNRFLEMAEGMKQPATMSALSFEGCRDGKAHLTSWRMNRVPRTIHYWTSLRDFPMEVRTAMQEQTAPWEAPSLQAK